MQKHVEFSISHLSDYEVLQLAESSPAVDKGAYIDLSGEPSAGHVARIASDVVAKYEALPGHSERLSAALVRKHTAVPAPVHGRIVRAPIGFYLLQQYVPGRVLLDVWPQLGWWMRLRVAVTLRFYVSELRSISSRTGPPPFPGPISDDGTPQTCNGRLFTGDGSGPFRSYGEMSRWYQNRLLVMQRCRKEGLGCAPFDDSAPLVFTHMDLHPRNVILGDDGQLWIVDWSEAGWYPSWFEAASMELFAKRCRDIPSSWAVWIPFIAGSCEKPGQLPFMRAILYSLVVMSADIMNLVGVHS